MKKNVGISISKCLKSAAKNRRANQTARAILTAPTVFVGYYMRTSHGINSEACTLFLLCNIGTHKLFET